VTNESPPSPAVDLTIVRATMNAPLLSDILDGLGYPRQCLSPGIAPVGSEEVLAGFAFPLRIKRVREASPAPYQGVISAVDAAEQDEVIVIPSDRATDFAVWGDLLTAAARARGAAGVLTDGLVRDARAIQRLGLPVFSGGTNPRDSKGRHETVAHRVAVSIDGVRIEPGDLVFGDPDGVVVIPRDLAPKVVDAALAKGREEDRLLQAVVGGASMTEAFQTFQVL
jgi:4-hydroxy-4-methyl-2-oxoglutarate aldolase